MQLSTLQAKARYLLGEITSDNYSDTNLNRALNDYYHQAISKAVSASGQWEVNGEVATTNIVAGQREYTLPASILTLKAIEANLTGVEDDWTRLSVVDMRSLGAVTNEQDTEDYSDREQYINLYDNAIFFIRPPKNSVTAGLKIYMSEEATELSNSTDEPSLPEHLQMYLVFGACMDYSLRISDDSGYKKFQQELFIKANEIKEHYSNRLTAVRPRIITRRENYN